MSGLSLAAPVSDDEHGGVPQVLKLAQFAEHDGEPEVDVGGGGIDAELDPQRSAPFELLRQIAARDDIDRARGQQLELAIDVHG